MRNRIATITVILLLIIYASVNLYTSEKSFNDISSINSIDSIILIEDNFSASLKNNDDRLIKNLKDLSYRKSLRNLEKIAIEPKFQLNDHLIIYSNGIIKSKSGYYLIVFENADRANDFNNVLSALREKSDDISIIDTIVSFDYSQTALENNSSDDSNSLSIDLDYYPINDFNSNLVSFNKSTVKLDNFTSPVIKRTSDGYYVLTKSNNQLTLSKEEDNSFQKMLAIDMTERNINSLHLTDQGTMIALLSSWPYSSHGKTDSEGTLLVEISNEAIILNELLLPDISGSRFKFTFMKENGNLLILGETSNNGQSDITVSEMATDGQVIWEKTFIGNDFEYVQSADYHNNTLIFSGWTNSKDSDLVAVMSDEKHINYLASMNSTGDVNWIRNPVNRYANICFLDNDKVLFNEEFSEDEMVYIMDLDFNLISKIHVPLSKHAKFSSSGDGGFYMSLQRSTKTLPQPPHISSIWTDEEVVLMRYAKEMVPVWTITRNDYPEDIRKEQYYILH